MSSRTHSYSISAGTTVNGPGGRFFFIKSATAPLNITTQGNTVAPIDFQNVGAGFKFGPVAPDLAWRYLNIYSATAQVVELIVSDDAEVDVANTVNVAGSVGVMEVPSTALNTPPRVALATGLDTLIIAANLARKKLSIQNPPSNTDDVVVGEAGALGASQGIVLEPGAVVQYVTTAAVYGRSLTGTPSVQAQEEI